MTDMLFIFDIPVYRLPKEKYYAERESSIEKQMYGTDPNKIARRKAFYEHNKDSAILLRFVAQCSRRGSVAVRPAAKLLRWALQYKVSRHSSNSRERAEFPTSVKEVVALFALTLS
jgi:hypothetical protein